jgi:glycosyltransferase involved in cell wall biosynthesis
MQKLVSVIIPCYNYGPYLSQCVKSALDQTYKNIEIIIINDGSTDNTESIAKKYEKNYKNIKYYSQENRGGIVKTRNRGIKLAKGDYLVQLDADDWIDPSYIKKTLQKAQKDNLDIVYTQAQIFGREEFLTNFPKFNIEFLKHSNFINSTALVKKKVFEKREYDEYLEDKGDEDWDFFLGACLDGAKTSLVNEALLHYRKHNHSKSRQDSFEGGFKEVLVRHHILNKQNSRHPEAFWYFSPYIEILKKSIELYLENDKKQESIKSLEGKLARIEKTLAYRAYKKLKNKKTN